MRQRRRRTMLLAGVATLLTIAPAGASAQQSGDRPGQPVRPQNPTIQRTYQEQQLRDAPAARDVWALLEHRVPAVISRRLDVGGSATGTQGLFSARGTTWRENVFLLEGIDVTDPAVRGTSGFYYDYGAFESVRAAWGTQPASVATGGVLVDLRVRGGGDAWHGAAQGYFELDALQADNLGDELAAQGVTAASAIDYLSDVSLQAGGPVSAGRAWIFGAYRDLRISQAEPRFVDPVLTTLPIATLKADVEASERDRVSAFWSLQRYGNPARGAGSRVAPEATSIEESTVNLVSGSWRRTVGGGALERVAVRGGYLDIDFPLGIQPSAIGQSAFDIVTRERTGAAPLAFDTRRRRISVDADAGLGAGSAASRHDIVIGAHYQRAPTRTAITAVDDVNIFTSAGLPFLAQLLNTPVTGEQNVRGLGAFFHDDLGVGGRFGASIGVRYDDWQGSLPAQSSPAGTYSPARDFAAVSDAIGWRSIAPRIALTYDVFGDGDLVVVGGFAQYTHQLSAGTLGFANPNSLGTTLVSWTDADGDGQFRPGEGGPVMSVAGGAFGQVDADLQAPLTRELRLGGQYALGDRWRAGIDLWYRKDSRLFDDVEVALGQSDFEQTVVLDPGRDNVLNTADDLGLLVFNQLDGFGAEQFVLGTVDRKTVTYKGIDLSIHRPWADDWTLRADLTLSLTEGDAGKSPISGDAGGISDLFNDPNLDINADARLFWDRPYTLKVYGSYLLPHGVAVAGVLRSWAGAPRRRVLPVPLNQGIIDVTAEPLGALREAPLTTADVRFSKDFDVGARGALALFADVFNVTNAGTVVRTHETFPIFGIPAEIVPPLVFRVGARIGF